MFSNIHNMCVKKNCVLQVLSKVNLEFVYTIVFLIKSSFAVQVGNIFNHAHLLLIRSRPLEPILKARKKSKNTGNKGRCFLCTDN